MAIWGISFSFLQIQYKGMSRNIANIYCIGYSGLCTKGQRDFREPHVCQAE